MRFILIIFFSFIFSEPFEGLILISDTDIDTPETHLIDNNSNIINIWTHETGLSGICYLTNDSILYAVSKINNNYQVVTIKPPPLTFKSANFFSGGFNIYKILIYFFLGVLIFTKIRANFGPEVLIFYLKNTFFAFFPCKKAQNFLARFARGPFFFWGF